MTRLHPKSPTGSTSAGFESDVLVIGGGPAGTWAALKAAQRGASVVLADKGYCGSSGATASAGTAIWYVPPDPDSRDAAMASRFEMGGRLADHGWMRRVLNRTWDGVNELADDGYPFPSDAEGRPRRNSLQGPEYMRLMRKRIKEAGVKILDQSPALELLRDEAGAVCGARGIDRQRGGFWTVRAGAVVMATGGCAFLSRALGCNVLTGDGLLMGAEVGAELSGMEFSNAYGIAPESGSVTKTLFYNWATFTDADGVPIPGAASKGGRSVIARELLTRKVYARLDRADGATRQAMRAAQPNFFLPFDRQGIDPFEDLFPVTLRLEGTVRGTGGLRIVGDDCATSVPGLYAAGDAATRELICGGFTGGGSHNAAWAMSSGMWAGEGAADHALYGAGSRVQAKLATKVAATTGLRGVGAYRADAATLTRAVQDEVLPFEKNYFRHGDILTPSVARLDALWRDLRGTAPAASKDVLAVREAAAMLATARWMYRSALARTETRGMHKRYDHLERDPSQHHYLITGGLDEVWTRSAPCLSETSQDLRAPHAPQASDASQATKSSHATQSSQPSRVAGVKEAIAA